MRRFLLVVAVAVALVAGCSGFRDLFTAHADVAATAAGQELKAERLAELLSKAKGIKFTHETAAYVAGLWVDYMLFAEEVAARTLPADSAGTAEVMWPQLAEIRATHWHDSLLARRGTITPAAADSVYRADSLRVLQHILFHVGQKDSPVQHQAARRKAEDALAKLRRGADFGVLASQLSDDPGSKRDQGYLPPSPRGAFVTAFDSAGWSLAPGGTSGVVETPFGYHIIHRPTAQVVQGRLTEYLVERAGVRLDSMYMDSLATIRQLSVSASAPNAIRGAISDRDAAHHSGKTLATWRGGKFTLRDFMRWIDALPPQYTAQLEAAPDSVLSSFTKVVAQNSILIAQAESAGVRETPAEWADLRAKFLSGIDSLQAALGLDAEVVDPTAPLAERSRVAAARVESYFDRVLAGQQRLRPMPAPLSTLLRARGKYRVNQAALDQAVAIADAKRSSADSAAAMNRGVPPGGAGLQPAPGPAPRPGGAQGAPQTSAPTP